MIRGIEASASGLLAGRRRTEVVADNLANLETAGYRADQAISRAFPELFLARLRDPGPGVGPAGFGAGPIPDPAGAGTGVGRGPTGASAPTPVGIGSTYAGVYIHEIVPRFEPGPIVATGRPLDLALVADLDPLMLPEGVRGPGAPRWIPFFAVQPAGSPAGTVAYTRDGRLTIDPEGYLATSAGDRLLVVDEGPDGVPIGAPHPLSVRFGTAAYDVRVEEGGRIRLVDPEAPAFSLAYRPAVAVFADRRLPAGNDPAPDVPAVTGLVKDGGNRFRMGGAPVWAGLDGRFPLGAVRIERGAFEAANVDLARAMTEAMAAYRYFEANQRALLAADGTLNRLINEVGKV